jgi:hypothetical protein
MSIEYLRHRAAQARAHAEAVAAAAADGSLVPLPEPLRRYTIELETFYEKLPALICQGLCGKYLVIREERFYGAWDTLGDAQQYAYEKFPDGHFLTQKIDERLMAGLEPHFGPHPDWVPI